MSSARRYRPAADYGVRMDLRIFTEPQQGASHSDLLGMARATLVNGFSGFFRSDHVLSMGSAGLPGPSESLVSLGAIATQVPGIRLGTLVASATFRHPSMLAIGAATVDDISGGRLELGIGAGWFQAEHTAYGLTLPADAAERFDRLTEQLEIITGLWAADPDQAFEYQGRYFQLAGAPGLPKPQQRAADGTPKIPIVIGGHGPKRTPALAARFADDFNVGFSDLAATRTQHDRGRAACGAIGRDPGALTYSAAQTVFCGRDDAEVARRVAAAGHDLDDARARPLTGTPDQLLESLAAWADAGVQRVYLQVLDLTDLDHVALLGEQVLTPARAL